MINRKTIIFVAGLCAVVIGVAPAVSSPDPGMQEAVSNTGLPVQPVSTGAISSDTAGAKNAPLPSDSAAAPPCTLKVTTEPAGAAVYLDEVLKGESPVSIPGIAPGDYVITLRKTGCFGKKATITVNPASVTDLSFVLLQPGFLKVETQPAGAEIWIDGKKEGITPYETGRIKPGDHAIKVTLAKYAPQERTVTISNGGRDSLNLVLEYSRAYKEELAVEEAAKKRAHKEGVYLGVVSVLFVAGAIVMVFLEAIGQ